MPTLAISGSQNTICGMAAGSNAARFARRGRGGDLGLGDRLVRERGPGGDVADGEHAPGGAARCVDDDAARVVELDADDVEPELVGVGHASDRDQDGLGGDLDLSFAGSGERREAGADPRRRRQRRVGTRRRRRFSVDTIKPPSR